MSKNIILTGSSSLKGLNWSETFGPTNKCNPYRGGTLKPITLTVSRLLDKPCPQVWYIPFSYMACLPFIELIIQTFSIPTARRFSSNFASLCFILALSGDIR